MMHIHSVPGSKRTWCTYTAYQAEREHHAHTQCTRQQENMMHIHCAPSSKITWGTYTAYQAAREHDAHTQCTRQQENMMHIHCAPSSKITWGTYTYTIYQTHVDISFVSRYTEWLCEENLIFTVTKHNLVVFCDCKNKIFFTYLFLTTQRGWLTLRYRMIYKPLYIRWYLLAPLFRSAVYRSLDWSPRSRGLATWFLPVGAFEGHGVPGENTKTT